MTTQTPALRRDSMGDVKSFDDAMALLADAGISIKNVEEYGEGFKVCDNLMQLVSVPFIILDISFSTGDFGEFAILRVVTKYDEKFIITDGSTGIYRQVKGYIQKTGETSGYAVPRGLTVSEFRFSEETGSVVRPGEPGYDKAKPAKTFYLAE